MKNWRPNDIHLPDSGSIILGRNSLTKIKDTAISRKQAGIIVKLTHYELPASFLLVAYKTYPAVSLNGKVVARDPNFMGECLGIQ
jgi:hypothetical protein